MSRMGEVAAVTAPRRAAAPLSGGEARQAPRTGPPARGASATAPPARRRAAGGAGAAEDLERLVERLIRTVSVAGGQESGPRAARHADDQVLLDVELLGVRCLLVRRPEAAGAVEAVGATGAAGDAAPGVPASPGAEVTLSPREREIARMVARGYPNKTIAGVLEISSWTVSTHLRRIFAKLAVTSRAAMVAQLAAAGLMDPLR
jgi:DNA-binding CsgD family transcriptional regulator